MLIDLRNLLSGAEDEHDSICARLDMDNVPMTV